MNLLSVLLALANIVIAISKESSNLIPVNHYARIRNSGEGRNLVDLGAIYNIPEPIVYYCDSSASFVLLFDVNDYITDAMFSYVMYARDGPDGECTVDITDNSYLTPGMVFDELPRGDGSGMRQVALYLEADSNLIHSSPVYFNPEDQATPNPDALPYINFCNRLMVSNDDGMLVNWLDIEFFFFLQLKNVGFFEDRRTLLASAHIQEEEEAEDSSRVLPWFQNHEQRSRKLLNCFDGFSIVFFVGTALTVSPAPSAPTISPAPTPYDGGVIIDPKEPLDLTKDKASFNASEFYNVLAYLCHDDLEPLTADEQSTFVRSQGSATIKVCIERNAKCVRDSVYLRRIDAFSWFRGNIRQIAVAPVNLPADNGLTELYCVPGSHKCWFDSLLMADFFTTPGLVSGSGAASLQFGSSSSSTRRFLQENNDNVGKTRGFSLNFGATTDELLAAAEAFKLEDDEESLNLGGILGIALACLLALRGCCLVLPCRGRGYHCCRRGLPVLKSPDHETEVLEDPSLDGFPEAPPHTHPIVQLHGKQLPAILPETGFRVDNVQTTRNLMDELEELVGRLEGEGARLAAKTFESTEEEETPHEEEKPLDKLEEKRRRKRELETCWRLSMEIMKESGS